MKQYLDLLNELLAQGTEKGDRTGTGTLSKFGHQMRFNLAEGFPVVTTKQIHMKSVVHELLWMLSGSTNIKYLQENGVHIWDEWVDENGDLGPVYGQQWRAWRAPTYQDNEGYLSPHARYVIKEIDQISQALDQIKCTPDSRRIMVTAWNPADVDAAALPPCHCLFQFYVANGKLSCQVYQRSADTFLGVPFNIASYALLTHMMAQQADLEVGDLIWTGGDTHLYLNHIAQAETQVRRNTLPLPKLWLNKAESIFDYKIEDFELIGYTSWPALKAEVSV